MYRLVIAILFVVASTSRASTTGTPRAEAFAGPIYVSAPGLEVNAYELFRAMDVPFTLDLGDHPKLGAHRTLVIVPGFLLASTDEYRPFETNYQELNRIRALIGQAKKAQIKILVLHVSGRAGRNSRPTSGATGRIDESNRVAADAADQIIVAGDGDYDGFFSSRAKSRGIPCQIIAHDGLQAELLKVFKAYARIPAAAVGTMAPVVTSVRTPDGSLFDLRAFRGKWVALCFWWDAPRFNRQVIEAQKKYGAVIQFVGVLIDESTRYWKMTVRDTDPGWRHVRNGKANENLAAAFDIITPPAEFLIDPSGKIVGRFVRGEAEFLSKLGELFGIVRQISVDESLHELIRGRDRINVEAG